MLSDTTSQRRSVEISASGQCYDVQIIRHFFTTDVVTVHATSEAEARELALLTPKNNSELKVGEVELDVLT